MCFVTKLLEGAKKAYNGKGQGNGCPKEKGEANVGELSRTAHVIYEYQEHRVETQRTPTKTCNASNSLEG